MHRSTHTLKRSALALAITVAASGSFAQSNNSGSIIGHASSSGPVLIENLGTGLKREISTDENGNFRASALPTGRYKVTFNGQTREVTVSVGTGSAVSFQDATLDVINVTGDAVNPIDLASVESSTIFSEEQIDDVPVARDVTSVALLAPGTTRGDQAFGNLASFGGASVAENAYFINGFNVTNIYKGVAYTQLPFESIAETQIKTGGYGAEFGRSTGGVVNIITKRGTNEWSFGANAFWTPESLASTDPDVYYADGEIYNSNQNEDNSDFSVAAYASGALIQDRLFLYALYQGAKRENSAVGNVITAKNFSNEGDDPLWFTKLDWNISDNHLFELTAFTDERKDDTTVYVQGADGRSNANRIGTVFNKNGGQNFIGKYTGYLTDSFTLSALYGHGEYKREAIADAACPIIIDLRDVANPLGGCWSQALQQRPDSADERDAMRLDAEWALGDHQLRFGYDRENWNTIGGAEYSGSAFYRYQNVVPGVTVLNGAVVPAGVTEVVRLRVFENGGDVDVIQTAFYIEDSWQISDNLRLYGGLRNETFDNKNPAGESFTKITNQLAPRFGFSWDAKGDSSLKVFGNAGRYYLPVAANTNVRAGGSELDYREFYTFTGIDPVTNAPTLGQQIGGRQTTSNGVIPNPRSVADQGLDPMFQEEYILGMQTQIGQGWAGGVRAIHRNLKRAIDDTCDHRPFERWAEENNVEYDGTNVPGCVLFNPGQDFTSEIDIDSDGDLETVHLTPEMLGYDPIVRKYNAFELFFERPFDGKWFLQGSWTIAHSYGNTEGYVKSDIGQDDAGVTQDFDFPELMEGAYGNLPNDRRHTLKLFGAYQLSEQWQIGANVLVQAGRPRNCIGYLPDQENEASAYEDSFFYCNGVATPRGSLGNSSWQRNLDMNLEYRPAALEGKLALKADVFNVFNSHTVTEVNEDGEDAPGVPAAEYLLPTGFQAPRAVRFSLSYDF